MTFGSNDPTPHRHSVFHAPVARFLMLLCLHGFTDFFAAQTARAEESIPSSPAQNTAARCKAIESDEERLKCYDRAEADDAARLAESIPPAASLMGTRWELDPGTSHELFSIRPHKQVYVLVGRYSTSVNNQPSSPTEGTFPQSLGYLNTEMKFQLSFKLKAMQIRDRFDLWLGYTQLSFFQVYNKARSAPFRESNYEPEIMGVIHTDYDLFGLKGRFINLGLVHQSNGRMDPLSRSWNRVYAQFGFERGPFGLTIRGWHRIHEDWGNDNNPDITDYIGRGDLVATYVMGGHTLSLLLRSNLNFWNFHGATQLNWSFPLYHQVKGYVQLFTGYGESLIDYNHYQTTIGAGFLLIDWM
jgi:phospholipase A1